MTKRRTIGAVAIVLLVLLFVACSAIHAGRVTNKAYEEPYSWIQTVCASYDAKSNCTVWVPITHNEPAKYRFDIEDGDKTGWVYVSPEAYETYQVGDWVDFGN